MGCVFVQVEIEQMFYPVQLATQESFDPAASFKYTSAIQFNILADIDALSFKPSRQDSVAVLSLHDFLLHGVSSSSSSSKPAGEKAGRPKKVTSVTARSALASSHKSLSTLSRVLRLLTKQQSMCLNINYY